MSYHRSQSVYLPGRRRTVGLGATGSQMIGTIGGGLLQAAPFTGPAAPFVAMAGAIASFLASMGVGSGCGQSCVLSTAYANKAEALLRQNTDLYFSQPSPRTDSQKAAALQNYQMIWNDLMQQCSNPQLGSAGQRCISDRQAGACKWKQTGASPWPNGPAVGQCWNWDAAYRVPIAQDATVPDPQTSVSDSLASVFGGSPSSSSLLPLAAIAALVVIGASL